MNRIRETLFITATFAFAEFALSGCGGSGGNLEPPIAPPDPSESLTHNFATAVLELEGMGKNWLVLVSEDGQGRDLNNDGDTTDVVYHALDLATRQLINLGLAASKRPAIPGNLVPPPATRFDHSLAAFFVDEVLQGATDLNGDGDASDTVLYFYDFATGQLSSTELGVLAFDRRGFELEDDLAAFLVSEEDHGRTDLNDDGIPNTQVLHLRAPSGELRNTREAALPTLKTSQGHVGFMKPEFTGDLNGDGDRNDFSVFHVYDAGLDAVVPSGLATDLGLLYKLGDLWLVLVNEHDDGRLDRNGDGDANDLVFHTFDATNGEIKNLGISSRRGSFSAIDANRALLPIEETSMASDLNADGDMEDVVIFLFDAHTQELQNTRLATRGFQFDQFLFECAVGIAVSEAQQGARDLNGDGDIADAVFHTFDPLTGMATNAGFDALEFRAADQHLLFLQSEVLLNVDLNGDGDTDDPILGLWNSCTDELFPTTWSSTGTIDTNGAQVLISTLEGSVSRDLNGDGDSQDSVLNFIDLQTKEVHELGLAFLDARLVSPTEALVLVDEAQEGEDLNGDGDVDDFVLHVVGWVDLQPLR